jgi:beta-lactamase superfamily II metal-dependent hydrolase
VSGLIDIVEQMPVGGAVIPVVSESTPEYEHLLKELHRHKVKSYPVMKGTVIKLDASTRMKVLYPTNKETAGLDANDLSIVMLLEYKSVGFLFAGDSTEDSEIEICKTYPDLRAQVLKVGHHGSAGSSCRTWLEQVRPSLAVISVGRDNRFGLPSPETLQRIEHTGCKVLRTDIDGAVTITTDGDTIDASISANR